MLSCRDLDGFVDALCDVTRDMNGIDRAREAAVLLERIEQVPQRFLMQWRAAAVADLHYLDGLSIRKIAERVGKAFQGVAAWLRDYGPTQYVSLINEDGQVRAVLFAVDGEQTKVKVRQFRAAGRIVVPATENLIDGNGEVRGDADLDELWNRLSQAPS